jgi:hypothetical protein
MGGRVKVEKSTPELLIRLLLMPKMMDWLCHDVIWNDGYLRLLRSIDPTVTFVAEVEPVNWSMCKS